MKPAVLLTLIRGVELLAEALLDRADVELVTLYDKTIPLLKDKGIPFTYLLDYLPQELQFLAAWEAERRCAFLENELAGPVMRSEWPHLAADPATWDAVAREVAVMARRDSYAQMALIEAMRCCAAQKDLRAVVVHQDICMDTKTVVFAARRLGIASLHTLHGYYYGVRNMQTDSFSDLVSVPGEPMKRLFESFGVPADRVVITGNFEWDAYARPPRPGHREKACALLGVDPDRPVLTYALTYPHRFSEVSATRLAYGRQTTEAVVEAFRSLEKSHPDWQFVLRPHPNDPDAPKDLADLCRRAGLERFHIDAVLSPYCSVLVSDLVACTQSNLGVEAILVGKPVVNCIIESFGGPIFREGMGALFEEDDAVINVRRVEDIAPAFEAALTDPATRARLRERRPASIRRFNDVNDGNALGRLAELVLHAVRNRDTLVPRPNRFPEFETALADAVPGDARRILVAGRAARHVAGRLTEARPELEIEVASAPTPANPEPERFDAVVLTDPLPHSDEADPLLTAAVSMIGEGACLLVAARHGAAVAGHVALQARAWTPPVPGTDPPAPIDGYSRAGLETVLSRHGLELTALIELANAAYHRADSGHTADTPLGIDGWVACARMRRDARGPWARERIERRRRACAANAEGESLFATGDPAAAAERFAAAIALWDAEAVFHNNLCAALYAMNRLEPAWHSACQALRLNPELEAARDNLLAVAAGLGREREAEELLRTLETGRI